MAVTIENGSFVGKDQDGNIVRVRGWTDNDVAKIKTALNDVQQIKTDLKSINAGQKELAYKDYTVVENDIKEKQETVPYNLSLGGGTQGLADGIWLDFRKINETKYPLENNFAGSFIGDIQWMKFSNCFN